MWECIKGAPCEWGALLYPSRPIVENPYPAVNSESCCSYLYKAGIPLNYSCSQHTYSGYQRFETSLCILDAGEGWCRPDDLHDLSRHSTSGYGTNVLGKGVMMATETNVVRIPSVTC